jgi:hypothetical protein
MDDTAILSSLFRESVLIDFEESHGKHHVELVEPSASDSKVIIKNLPSDAFIINVDKSFDAPARLFQGGHGECKRADFAVISHSQKCILIIELKRTKSSWCDIVNQLRGADCFIRYCCAVGSCFWNEDAFLQGYKKRFISIGHTSIPKRTTRVTCTSDRHDTPETAMKIDWPHHLQFNRLAGNAYT